MLQEHLRGGVRLEKRVGRERPVGGTREGVQIRPAVNALSRPARLPGA